MTVRPSITFSDFSGSAKGVVAWSTKGGSILPSKSQNNNITTLVQAVSRDTLPKISRSYKQLSDSKMKGWETLAGKIEVSTFGKVAKRLIKVLTT